MDTAPPHQDHGNPFSSSTLRPSTGQSGHSENISIRTDDTEGMTIHKTVLKWYEKAKQPSLYQKKSFGSLGGGVGMGVSDTEPSTVTPGSSTAAMIREKGGGAGEGTPVTDFGKERRSNGGNGDEIAVGWESPQDSENPLDWSDGKKALNLAVIILICFTS